MKHPGPQLTDYLDGTLAPDARAAVEAHLTSCATCREEVRLASAGRQIATGLPEPATPPGLADAAIQEARGLAAGRAPEVVPIDSGSRPRPTTSRWLAIAGAAAVVVLIAVAAPRIGRPGTVQEAAAPAAAAASAVPAATAVEVRHANVTFARLASAAQSLRSTADFAGAGAGASPEVTNGASAPSPVLPPVFDGSLEASPERLPAATQCLEQAFEQEATGTLTRVVQARYEGTPAYFGLYAVGPGAGLPPTQLRLLVASVNGCEILAQTTLRV
jgi:anti-sigma factor RsiW